MKRARAGGPAHEMPKGHKPPAHERAGGPAHEMPMKKHMMPNGTMMVGDMPMKPMPKKKAKK